MKTARQQRRNSPRQGITLIELLVVIFIMLTITAIAIPVMIPSIEDRRLRETSRVITSHFQGARTRAIQTGKNFGVMIEPQGNLTSAGITLSYMVEAASWSGDTSDSGVRVIGGLPPAAGAYGLIDTFITNSNGQPSTETGWIGLIRPGDTIRLNNQGAWYRISSGEPFNDTNSNGVRDGAETYVDLDADTSYDAPQLTPQGTIKSLPWTLTPLSTATVPSTGLAIDTNGNGVLDASPTPPTPPNDAYNPCPFTIRRQPTKTAAHPLQLPNAMAVDLAWSGTSGLPAMNGLGPITILFTPTGALHSVYFYQNNLAQSISPAGPLYLLIGKIEKIGNTAAGTRNYEDATNLWVTIHPQTGLITATEAGVDVDNDGTVTLVESKQFATHALTLGGR